MPSLIFFSLRELSPQSYFCAHQSPAFGRAGMDCTLAGASKSGTCFSAWACWPLYSTSSTQSCRCPGYGSFNFRARRSSSQAPCFHLVCCKRPSVPFFFFFLFSPWLRSFLLFDTVANLTSASCRSIVIVSSLRVQALHVVLTEDDVTSRSPSLFPALATVH